MFWITDSPALLVGDPQNRINTLVPKYFCHKCILAKFGRDLLVENRCCRSAFFNHCETLAGPSIFDWYLQNVHHKTAFAKHKLFFFKNWLLSRSKTLLNQKNCQFFCVTLYKITFYYLEFRISILDNNILKLGIAREKVIIFESLNY